MQFLMDIYGIYILFLHFNSSSSYFLFLKHIITINTIPFLFLYPVFGWGVRTREGKGGKEKRRDGKSLVCLVEGKGGRMERGGRIRNPSFPLFPFPPILGGFEEGNRTFLFK
ncbi:hypothetical protein L1049_010034 [Liquidambar formosana]|uniref:Uncharacterized protein n=1 Tax=Liquidambar formosana TaxID=63359 RepID=A0AAP0N6T5_LIQFO